MARSSASVRPSRLDRAPQCNFHSALDAAAERMSSPTPPPSALDEESMSHDESSIDASSSDMSSSAKPNHLKRGGTVRGKSITGRMSKFEDTTTKSNQKLAVIGAPLAVLLDFDGQSRTLPLVLKNCMDALRDDEAILKSSTLFRAAPGPEIAEIESKFRSPNLSVNMLSYDANVTANFLLHWLSKLPECLLTSSKYSKFSKAARIEDAARSERKLARLVKSLPPSNCNTLQYLLIFLKELQTHEADNKLTTATLAAIFGPILHRRPHADDASDGDASSGLSQGESDTPAPQPPISASVQVASRLISGYANIFADLTLEDKEVIPEDQLNEEVVKAKRKGNTLIRSNSQSIDKPMQRKMVVSSSAENLAASPPSSGRASPVNPTVSSKPATGSSPTLSTHAASHASPMASPASTPISSPATSHKPRSTSNGSDEPPEKQDKEKEKEKEKKGFKSTLRKLGLVGKDKKDKSPGRARSGSTSSRPSDLPPFSPSTPSTPTAGNGQSANKPASPTAVFGMSFELLLEVPDGHKPRVIPNILKDCFDYLRSADRTKEFGVFRESGSFTEKARLKDAYDSPNVRIDLDGSDGFTVAALAKDWLRDMPDCLLTEALYVQFKECIDDEGNETSERLAAAISKLSAPRRTCLHYIMEFFKTQVVAHQKENKMGESNVGIVIGPCLHRKAKPTPEELMDPCHNQIVTHMLSNYDEVFAQWTLTKLGSVPRGSQSLSSIQEAEDSETGLGEKPSDDEKSESEVVADPPGTVWKKALDLEKATSVLDEINRKMVATANTESTSGSTTGSGEGSPRSGSMPSERLTSSDANVSPGKPKDKDRKRKGSGIFDMWDRFKEEAGGSGRRRSNTASGDVAPFQERTKITRSTSTKAAPVSPKGSTTPNPGEVGPTTSTAASQDAPVSPTSSKKGTSESASGTSVSPKVSPRVETRRTNSTSNLTIRTISSGSLQGSTPSSPSGSPTPQLNLSLGSGTIVGETTTPTPQTPQTPQSPLDSPASFGVAVEPSARKKAKRSSRLRELSTGSSKEMPPASPAVLLNMLPPEQLESWLTDNGYGDIIPKLKGTSGKQLVALSKADLRSEFGVRGVSLWNDVHHAASDLSARSQEDTTSAVLTAQVVLLTNKVDELMVKLTIQQQQHQVAMQQQLQVILQMLQGVPTVTPVPRENSTSPITIPFHVVQQPSRMPIGGVLSDTTTSALAAAGAATPPPNAGWRRSDLLLDSPVSLSSPVGSAPSTPSSASEPVKRFGIAPEAPLEGATPIDAPSSTENIEAVVASIVELSEPITPAEKHADENVAAVAVAGVSAEEVAVGVASSTENPTSEHTTYPHGSTAHMRYPTHEAPPVPSSVLAASSGAIVVAEEASSPISDDAIAQQARHAAESSSDQEQQHHHESDSVPQIEIVRATPRHSYATLDIPSTPSSESSDADSKSAAAAAAVVEEELLEVAKEETATPTIEGSEEGEKGEETPSETVDVLPEPVSPAPTPASTTEEEAQQEQSAKEEESKSGEPEDA